jgi:hypothetical protein
MGFYNNWQPDGICGISNTQPGFKKRQMKIQVWINDFQVYEEVTDSYNANLIIQDLERRYNIDLLKSCSVKADIAIQVNSRMNSPLFELPEFLDMV